MTSGKKRGLGIGAAMKQRMDSQEEQPILEVGGRAPTLGNEGDLALTPSTRSGEIEVLESFNTRLPRGLHRRLKVHTAREGHKIQDVVAQVLDEYLRKSDKKES